VHRSSAAPRRFGGRFLSILVSWTALLFFGFGLLARLNTILRRIPSEKEVMDLLAAADRLANSKNLQTLPDLDRALGCCIDRPLHAVIPGPLLVSCDVAAFLPFFRFFFLFSLLGSVALCTLEAIIRSERHALSSPLSEPNWNVRSCS
jgi:hypothetical protein